MVWIAKKLKETYPGFKKWLANDFQDVENNSKVWSSFVKWSGLGSEASTYIGSGIIPEIRVEDLIGNNGEYRPKEGDVIFLDKKLIAFVENNLENNAKDAKKIAESTILHEMCHWARSMGVSPLYEDDYGDGKIERGKHFEKDAYGGDVCFSANSTGGTVVVKTFTKNPQKKKSPK